MTVPDSLLPPESQPWGRSVDQRLTSLEFAAKLNNPSVDNNLKQLAASVNLLSNQVLQLSSSIIDLGQLGKSNSVTSGGFSKTTNGTTSNLSAMPSLSIEA